MFSSRVDDIGMPGANEALTQVLKTHAKCRTVDVAMKGAMAIHNLASNNSNKQKFAAAGALAVLLAICEDSSAPEAAKVEARDALYHLNPT